MVKTLEKISSEEKICLGEAKKYEIRKIRGSNPKISYGKIKSYICDCDQWGGGEPPCDNCVGN